MKINIFFVFLLTIVFLGYSNSSHAQSETMIVYGGSVSADALLKEAAFWEDVYNLGIQGGYVNPTSSAPNLGGYGNGDLDDSKEDDSTKTECADARRALAQAVADYLHDREGIVKGAGGSTSFKALFDAYSNYSTQTAGGPVSPSEEFFDMSKLQGGALQNAAGDVVEAIKNFGDSCNTTGVKEIS